MNLDFDSDPELKQLRDEFIDSLSQRKTKLAELFAAKEAVELRRLVHSLAGVAESYGFPNLGALAGEFDDWLEAGGLAQISSPEFSSRVSRLEKSLAEVIARRSE